MPNISISVKNKIAVQTNRTLYVCGNSDYTALFDLDAEWNAFEIKTARFCYNGHYSDVIFTGNECEIPVIADTNEFEIGLFAGNLHTTTPAMVLCERSILSTSGTPTNPSPDVYHQLIEKINSGMLRGPQGEKGSTGPQGPTGPAGPQVYNLGNIKGEKGEKGDTGSAGADGKDAPQIDDNTVTDSNPWSSKKIIDMLCPALEESGNPVTCEPVAGYPLGVVASWEPTQAGSGDPSPDNIRPIKGRDSVSVERCGVNLLNPKENAHRTYTPYGLTITYIGDNKVHLSGTYEEDGGSFAILDTQQKLLTGKGLRITGFTIDGTKQSYTLYGLRTKDETVIAMMAAFTKGDAIDMTVAIVVSGTTAPTTYSPYKGDTLDLQLPGTVYGGDVDAVIGEGKCTAKVITLDGISQRFTSSPSGAYWNMEFNSVPGIDKIIATSHFAKTYFGVNKSYDFVFTDPKTMENLFASVDELNAYLAAQAAAGTPVQIVYKLKTHTPIHATGAQPIPALAGCNTVLTDADSVAVTGRADPAHAIAALQAQLTVATQALAETQAAVVDTTAAIEQDCDAIGGGEDADAE